MVFHSVSVHLCSVRQRQLVRPVRLREVGRQSGLLHHQVTVPPAQPRFLPSTWWPRIDRGQSTEGVLPSSTVVGRLVPSGDREAPVLAGSLDLPVADVLVREAENALDGSAVPSTTHLTSRPDYVVTCRRTDVSPSRQLRLSVGMQDAAGDDGAPACGPCARMSREPTVLTAHRQPWERRPGTLTPET